MNTLDLHGYSYQDRQGVLPTLTRALNNCGGWVLDRKTISANSMEFKMEIQLRSIMELYGSLVATGVELTRLAHASLTDLCTARHHISLAGEPNQVVTLRLELTFLEDVTLHSLLMTGCSLA